VLGETEKLANWLPFDGICDRPAEPWVDPLRIGSFDKKQVEDAVKVVV
jgi:hypothetical protein